MNSYNSPEGAEQYSNFIYSKQGLVVQDTLYRAISSRLIPEDDNDILDVGCGPGWLSEKLLKHGRVCGCDASAGLIARAKKTYPGISFEVHDITQALPYQKKAFTTVVMNMAAHDVHDQRAAFGNIFSVLKPGGKFLITIANPYYAYPVGVWKRGIMGRLLFRKPRLKLRPYNILRSKEREFKWGSFLTPYFYPLSEQINNALSSGFKLVYMEDLQPLQDSKSFDLNYQLFRFPTILLFEFTRALET